MLLPHVLNSTRSAECAEFASIVIELVIGILLPPANHYNAFYSALQITSVVVK